MPHKRPLGDLRKFRIDLAQNFSAGGALRGVGPLHKERAAFRGRALWCISIAGSFRSGPGLIFLHVLCHAAYWDSVAARKNPGSIAQHYEPIRVKRRILLVL
jgi:hypothetical protein